MARKQYQKIIASFLICTFLVTNTFLPASRGFAQSSETRFSNEISAQNFQIPYELGQVSELLKSPESHGVILHIQTAHGHYEAQKNIQAILQYLTKNYQVDLLLLEGAGNQLQPELFRFFPHDKELNLKITDALTKQAQLTGAEAFLTDSPGKTQGWGIEDLQAYRSNRESFKFVVTHKKEREAFLNTLYLQIEQVATPYLNKTLKEFLRREDSYEQNHISLEEWLDFLKRQAAEYLKKDLDDPWLQKEWPVLARYFRLEKIGKEMDLSHVEKEKEKFFKDLKAYKIDLKLLQEVQSALGSESSAALHAGKQPPFLKTRFLFERLLDQLPENFSFSAYPHFRLYLQQLILMSELLGDGLHKETEALAKQLTDVLAKTKEEQTILGMLKDYHLMKKLFDLELSREEYEGYFKDAQEISPSGILNRLSRFDAQNRVRKFDPSAFDLQSIAPLFDTAVDFYEGAIRRESWMIQNILKRMSELKKEKAVLITGGFHEEGLKQSLLGKGFSYVQITPRMNEITNTSHEIYLRSLLGQSAIAGSKIEKALAEDPSFLTGLGDSQYISDTQNAIRETVREAIAEVYPRQVNQLGEQINRQVAGLFPQATLIAPQARAEVRGVSNIEFSQVMQFFAQKNKQKIDWAFVEKKFSTAQLHELKIYLKSKAQMEKAEQDQAFFWQSFNRVEAFTNLRSEVRQVTQKSLTDLSEQEIETAGKNQVLEWLEAVEEDAAGLRYASEARARREKLEQAVAQVGLPLAQAKRLILHYIETRARSEVRTYRVRPPVWNTVAIPHTFAASLSPFHLRPSGLKILLLKGEVPKNLFMEEGLQYVAETSIAQALGSILYAGAGKEKKEEADGNAVFLGERNIENYISAHPNEALVILGDEGARDNSYSLHMGSIYYHGYKNGIKKFDALTAKESSEQEVLSAVAAFKREIADLKAKGVRLYFQVADALENTNGIAEKEAESKPTNSWSMVATFDEFGSLVDDHFRVGGVSFSAPSDAGVTPFDLPSVALPKIAQANRVFADDFLNHHVAAFLGPRKIKKDYEKAEKHRHQTIIDDAQKLKTAYPGLKIISPGDGDLIFRVVSSSGVPLIFNGKTYFMTTFGRSGAQEATAAKVAAMNQLEGQFSHTYVSPDSTNEGFGRDSAYQYSGKEEDRFRQLGIQDSVYRAAQSRLSLKGKGLLAMTSVTGAPSDSFGELFANALDRVQFKLRDSKAADGTVTTNTLLINRQGDVLVLRATFLTPDLEKTKDELRRARESSPAARSELRTQENADENINREKVLGLLKESLNVPGEPMAYFPSTQELKAMGSGVIPILVEELNKGNNAYGIITVMTQLENPGVLLPILQSAAQLKEQNQYILETAVEKSVNLVETIIEQVNRDEELKKRLVEIFMTYAEDSNIKIRSYALRGLVILQVPEVEPLIDRLLSELQIMVANENYENVMFQAATPKFLPFLLEMVKKPIVDNHRDHDLRLALDTISDIFKRWSQTIDKKTKHETAETVFNIAQQRNLLSYARSRAVRALGTIGTVESLELILNFATPKDAGHVKDETVVALRRNRSLAASLLIDRIQKSGGAERLFYAGLFDQMTHLTGHDLDELFSNNTASLSVKLQELFRDNLPTMSEIAGATFFPGKWDTGSLGFSQQKMDRLKEFASEKQEQFIPLVYQWGLSAVSQWMLVEKTEKIPSEIFLLLSQMPNPPPSWQLQSAEREHLGIGDMARRVLVKKDPVLGQGLMVLILNSSADFSRSVIDLLKAIEENASHASELMAFLTIVLELKMVYLPDGWQQAISVFLNHDLGPDYYLVSRLLRSIPYPREVREGVNALVRVRDVRSLAAALTTSTTPVNIARYVRMKIHRSKDSSDRYLLAALLKAIKTQNTEPLREYIPSKYIDEVLSDLTPEVLARWHEIYQALLLAFEKERKSGQFSEPVTDDSLIPASWLQGESAKKIQVGDEQDRKFVLNALSLYHSLIAYYDVDEERVKNAGLGFGGEEVKEAIAESRTLDTVNLINQRRRSLKEESLKRVDELDIHEEKDYKRHIAHERWGFLNFGTDVIYEEPKFDAFNKGLYLEAYQNQLFKDILETQIPPLLEELKRSGSPKVLTELLKYLSALVDHLTISGLGSRDLENINDVLKKNRLNRRQIYDLLDMFSEEHKRILDYFNYTYTGSASAKKIAKWLGPRELLPKYRDLYDASFTEDEYAQLVEETLIGNLVGEEESIGIFEHFINELAKVVKDLDPSVVGTLAIAPETAAPPFVVRFGQGEKSASVPLNLVGKKGKNLMGTAEISLPVPPGFIFTTASKVERLKSFERVLIDEILRLEKITGKRFSFSPAIMKNYGQKIEMMRKTAPQTSDVPLILSVRSSSIISMPGQLGTIINAPMNDEVANEMIKNGMDAWLVYDLYRRFLSTYGDVVYGIKANDFISLIDSIKTSVKKKDIHEFTPDEMRKIVEDFKELIKKESIKKNESPFDGKIDGLELLMRSIIAVSNSWDTEQAREFRAQIHRSDVWKTAVVLQTMVFGNFPESGTAVIYSRDMETGQRMISGIHKMGSQGPDIVGGATTHYLPLNENQKRFPQERILSDVAPQLADTYSQLAYRLDAYSRAPQDIEVTNEAGKVYLLQTRNAERVHPHRQLLVAEGVKPSAQGAGVSGGAVIGRLLFTDPKMSLHDLRAKVRMIREQMDHRGEKLMEIVLVMGYITPDEALKMMIDGVGGIITPAVGESAHATLNARKLDKALVSGVRELHFEKQPKIDPEQKKWEMDTWWLGEKKLNEGDIIAIDGNLPLGSKTSGHIYLKPKQGQVGVQLDAPVPHIYPPTRPKSSRLQIKAEIKPVERTKPFLFEFDESQQVILTNAPVRLAINLGSYRINSQGQPTDVLMSNFDLSEKVVANTVSNRVFDAYLRQILGDPNISLTDIYGVENVERFYASLIGNPFHGRFPANSLELKKEGESFLLLINGYAVRIHQDVPQPALLKKNNTEYLIDFSDANLARETKEIREKRLQTLQAEASLKRVFSFSPDEDPSEQVVAPGINTAAMFDHAYLPLASPLTLGLAHILAVIEGYFTNQFEMVGGIEAIRPITGDAGNIRLVLGKTFAGALPQLFPDLVPHRQGNNAGMVEYDIPKGAGNVRILLIPTPGSSFAEVATIKDKDLQKKKMAELKAKINQAFKEAASNSFESYIRYAEENENLESLQGINAETPVVFDSQATTVLEPGKVELVFHFNDIGYAAALNRSMKDFLLQDGTPASQIQVDNFLSGLRRGKWREGTIPANQKILTPKVVKPGEEIGFIVVGARGRIGKLIYKMLANDPNYVPKAFLGIQDIDTFLAQYRFDVAHGSMDIQRDNETYELRKDPDSPEKYLLLFNKKTGQYLLAPNGQTPLLIPYFHIQQRHGEPDDAFERRMYETLGKEIIDETETVINASGFALNKSDKYYNAFASGKRLKRIIFTAPALKEKEEKGKKQTVDMSDLTVIRGNEGALIDIIQDRANGEPVFISCASCTTTGLGRVLMEVASYLETWGVKYIRFLTDHSMTPSQGDLYGAPSAGKSLRTAMDPKMSSALEATGANKAIVMVKPEFKGKLSGIARRDANYDGSLLKVSFWVPKSETPFPSVEEINGYFKWLSNLSEFKGILSHQPYVQSTAQIVGDKTASVFLPQLTRLEESKNAILLTLSFGYDNEEGYTAAVAHIEKLAALTSRGLITPESYAAAGEPLAAKRQFSDLVNALLKRISGYAKLDRKALNLGQYPANSFSAAMSFLSNSLKDQTSLNESETLGIVYYAYEAIKQIADKTELTEDSLIRKIEKDLYETHNQLEASLGPSVTQKSDTAALGPQAERRSEVRTQDIPQLVPSDFEAISVELRNQFEEAFRFWYPYLFVKDQTNKEEFRIEAELLEREGRAQTAFVRRLKQAGSIVKEDLSPRSKLERFSESLRLVISDYEDGFGRGTDYFKLKELTSYPDQVMALLLKKYQEYQTANGNDTQFGMKGKTFYQERYGRSEVRTNTNWKKYLISASLAGVAALGLLTGIVLVLQRPPSQLPPTSISLDPKQPVKIRQFDDLLKRAQAYADRPFKRQEIIPAPEFDYPRLDYQKALTIKPKEGTRIIDVEGTGAVPYPRKGTMRHKLNVFVETRLGIYEPFPYNYKDFIYDDPLIKPPLPYPPPQEVQHLSYVAFFSETPNKLYPELAYWEGAGYGRLNNMGRNPQERSVYGASERGFMQIGTNGMANPPVEIPEKFPELTDIFISKPSRGKIRFLQIYQHEDAVMARQVDLTFGDETIAEISGRIIPRPGHQIDASSNFGWGFSSMYWRGQSEGFTNENAAHDNDTLTALGQYGHSLVFEIKDTPKPKANARITDINQLINEKDHTIINWSLEQRDQNPSHYIQGKGVDYADRSSFFLNNVRVERMDRAGDFLILPTRLKLYHFPTQYEYEDNVVISQQLAPKDPIVPGEQVNFSYTMAVRRVGGESGPHIKSLDPNIELGGVGVVRQDKIGFDLVREIQSESGFGFVYEQGGGDFGGAFTRMILKNAADKKLTWEWERFEKKDLPQKINLKFEYESQGKKVVREQVLEVDPAKKAEVILPPDLPETFLFVLINEASLPDKGGTRNSIALIAKNFALKTRSEVRTEDKENIVVDLAQLVSELKKKDTQVSTLPPLDEKEKGYRIENRASGLHAQIFVPVPFDAAVSQVKIRMIKQTGEVWQGGIPPMGWVSLPVLSAKGSELNGIPETEQEKIRQSFAALMTALEPRINGRAEVRTGGEEAPDPEKSAKTVGDLQQKLKKYDWAKISSMWAPQEPAHLRWEFFQDKDLSDTRDRWIAIELTTRVPNSKFPELAASFSKLAETDISTWTGQQVISYLEEQGVIAKSRSEVRAYEPGTWRMTDEEWLEQQARFRDQEKERENKEKENRSEVRALEEIKTRIFEIIDDPANFSFKDRLSTFERLIKENRFDQAEIEVAKIAAPSTPNGPRLTALAKVVWERLYGLTLNAKETFREQQRRSEVRADMRPGITPTKVESVVVSNNSNELISKLTADLDQQESHIVPYAATVFSLKEYSANQHLKAGMGIGVSDKAVAKDKEVLAKIQEKIREALFKAGIGFDEEGAKPRFQIMRQDTPQENGLVLPYYFIIKLKKDELPFVPRSEVRSFDSSSGLAQNEAEKFGDRVNIYPDRKSMGKAAAELGVDKIEELLKKQKTVRIVFAAAPSQVETIAALIRLSKGLIDWRRIEIFHMDEFAGFPATERVSFRNWLNNNLVMPLLAEHNLRREDLDIHFLNADSKEKSALEKVANDYAKLLDEKPVDIVFGGYGYNGHVAFNDPPAMFRTKKSVIIVDPAKDPVNARQQIDDYPEYFKTKNDIPPAVTISMPPMKKAKFLIMSVPGKAKAEAIRDIHSYQGKPENAPSNKNIPGTYFNSLPASRIQVFTDVEGASLLPARSEIRQGSRMLAVPETPVSGGRSEIRNDIQQQVKALNDPKASVREAAAQVLTKMGEQAVPALVKVLKNEKAGHYAQYEATVILGKIKTSNQEAILVLTGALQNENIFIRKAALFSLGEIGSPVTQYSEVMERLTNILMTKGDREMRQRVIYALRKMGRDVENYPKTIKALTHVAELEGKKDQSIRRAAEMTLRVIQSRSEARTMEFPLENGEQKILPNQSALFRGYGIPFMVFAKSQPGTRGWESKKEEVLFWNGKLYTLTDPLSRQMRERDATADVFYSIKMLQGKMVVANLTDHYDIVVRPLFPTDAQLNGRSEVRTVDEIKSTAIQTLQRAIPFTKEIETLVKDAIEKINQNKLDEASLVVVNIITKVTNPPHSFKTEMPYVANLWKVHAELEQAAGPAQPGRAEVRIEEPSEEDRAKQEFLKMYDMLIGIKKYMLGGRENELSLELVYALERSLISHKLFPDLLSEIPIKEWEENGKRRARIDVPVDSIIYRYDYAFNEDSSSKSDEPNSAGRLPVFWKYQGVTRDQNKTVIKLTPLSPQRAVQQMFPEGQFVPYMEFKQKATDGVFTLFTPPVREEGEETARSEVRSQSNGEFENSDLFLDFVRKIYNQREDIAYLVKNRQVDATRLMQILGRLNRVRTNLEGYKDLGLFQVDENGYGKEGFIIDAEKRLFARTVLSLGSAKNDNELRLRLETLANLSYEVILPELQKITRSARSEARMLVLSRHVNESVMIRDDIEVGIAGISGTQARVAIKNLKQNKDNTYLLARNETVRIDPNTEMMVIEILPDRVRLGFTAPRAISIHRREVYDAIARKSKENISGGPRSEVRSKSSDFDTRKNLGTGRSEVRQLINPLLLSVQKQVREAGKILGKTTEEIDELLRPENVYKTWRTSSMPLTSGRKERFFIVRSRHRRPFGEDGKQQRAQGGIRIILPEMLGEGPDDPHSDFYQAVKQLTLPDNLQEAQIILTQFLENWVQDEAVALSTLMSFKNKVAALNLGGGKGVILLAHWENADGQWRLVPINDGKFEKRDLAIIMRDAARAFAEDGIIYETIDGGAPDVNPFRSTVTTEQLMGWMVDETLEYLMEQPNYPLWQREPGLLEELKVTNDSLMEKPYLETAYSYALRNSKSKDDGTVVAVSLPEISRYTGKNVGEGGSLYRGRSTGEGTVMAAEALMRKIEPELAQSERPLAGKNKEDQRTVAIQGFGNVGVYAAYSAVKRGAKVLAISDFSGALYKPEGFSEQDLKMLDPFQQGTAEKKSILALVESNKQILGQNHIQLLGKGVAGNHKLLELDVYLLILAALENQIHDRNADKIKARIVSEGANGGTTKEAFQILYGRLEEKRTYVIPSILASAGGVAISSREVEQNFSGNYVGEVALQKWLAEQMQKAVDNVWRIHEEKKVDLGTAAFLVGMEGLIQKPIGAANRSELRIEPYRQISIQQFVETVNRPRGGGNVRGFVNVTRLITDGLVSMLAYGTDTLDSFLHFFLPSRKEIKIDETTPPAAYPKEIVEKFEKAKKEIFGLSTKTQYAYILGPEFALDDGGLVFVRTVFGDNPAAVIIRNAGDRAFVENFNQKLEAAHRPAILMAGNVLEAQRALRDEISQRTGIYKGTAFTFQGIVGMTEIVAEALKEALRDQVVLVTPQIFERFTDVSGISSLVEQFKAQFQLAKSA